MTERSAEDLVTGVLRIAVGDSVREVPTLKARWIGEWSQSFAADDIEAKAIGEWTMDDFSRFAGESVDRLLDLVVAYDRTAALGGREWLAENADPAQLHAALVAMVGNAFPLASDPTVLVDLVIAQAAAGSIPPSSTSGASPSGTSTRTTSGRGSTRSR